MLAKSHHHPVWMSNVLYCSCTCLPVCRTVPERINMLVSSFFCYCITHDLLKFAEKWEDHLETMEYVY